VFKVSRFKEFLVVTALAILLNTILYFIFYIGENDNYHLIGSLIITLSFPALYFSFHSKEYKESIKDKISWEELDISNSDRFLIFSRIIFPVIVIQALTSLDYL
jgi:hypothetical protein